MVIGGVFLSSMFYGALRSSSMRGGSMVTISIGVDFGSGETYPERYQVPNKTALEVLNKTVKSLKVEDGRVKCISGICENETREWVFEVNDVQLEKQPSNYYPKEQDLIVFRYVNRSG